MDLKSIAQDLDKERDGVDITYPGTDIVFTIARIGCNPEYERFMKKALKHKKDLIRAGNLSDQDKRELLVPGVVKYVLMGWRNITITKTVKDGKGSKQVSEELKCNYKNASDLLSNPEYSDVYDFILTEANNAANYKAEELEEDIKN